MLIHILFLLLCAPFTLIFDPTCCRKVFSTITEGEINLPNPLVPHPAIAEPGCRGKNILYPPFPCSSSLDKIWNTDTSVHTLCFQVASRPRKVAAAFGQSFLCTVKFRFVFGNVIQY